MLAETINWGQSNINLVHQKGKRLMGAPSMSSDTQSSIVVQREQ